MIAILIDKIDFSASALMDRKQNGFTINDHKSHIISHTDRFSVKLYFRFSFIRLLISLMKLEIHCVIVVYKI